MGKVHPEFKDDAQALGQWIMRKIRNHDPMSVRVKAGSDIASLTIDVIMGVKVKHGASLVTMEEQTGNVLYQLADGRVFEFKVQDVTDTWNQEKTAELQLA